MPKASFIYPWYKQQGFNRRKGINKISVLVLGWMLVYIFLLIQPVQGASNLITGIKFNPKSSQVIIYSRYKIKKVYSYKDKKNKYFVIDVGKLKISTKIKSRIRLKHKYFSALLVKRKSRTTQIILVYRGTGQLRLTTRKTSNRIIVSWRAINQSKKNIVKKISLVSSLSELLKIESTKKINKIKLFYSNEPNRMIIDILNANQSSKLRRNWSIQNDVIQSIQVRNYQNKVRVYINFSEASSSDYKVYTDGNVISVIPKPGVVLVQTLNQLVENLRFKTDLTMKYARDLEMDNEFEASRDIRLLFDGGLKYSWAAQNFAKVGVRFRYIEEYDPELFTFSDVRFSETYLNFVGDYLRLGLGYQTVRWGRTDEFSPIDVINPEDMTEFLLNPRPERKLPVPMVRLGWFNDLFNIESVYVPWFQPSLLIYRDSDWAFFDHVVDHLTAQLAPTGQRFNDLNFVENEPDGDFFENREAGIRLTKSFNNFDVGITYYYGRDKTPLIKPRTLNGYMVTPIILDPTQLALLAPSLPPTFFDSLNLEDVTFDLFYHTFELYGFDLEATFWNIGFRAEIAYFDKRKFQQVVDLGIIEKNQLHYVLGFDHFVWENFYINFLFSHAEILEYDQPLINVRQTQMDIAGNVSWEMARDAYTLDVGAGYNLEDESIYLTPTLTWHQSDNLEFEIGLFYIIAEETAAASLFKNNNQAYLKGRFHF